MFPSPVSHLLALQLLLVAHAPPVHASVGSSFRNCWQFLYRQTPPRGVRTTGLRIICQHFQDKPRYATLYDPARRIPLYSAYTFKKSDGEKRVSFPWMYEPQLFFWSGTGNMLPFPRGRADPRVEESQAVLTDYNNVIAYERGQLNPDEHQDSPGDKAATYTLTNVVPQIKDFYQGPWSRYLDQVRQTLNNYCRGTAYVVTGVTTSGNMIRRENVDRVAIPRYVWSAYCCPSFDPNMPYEVRFKFPSYSAYGLNELSGHFVVELQLERLESLIKKEMPVDQNFQLFHEGCVPEV